MSKINIFWRRARKSRAIEIRGKNNYFLKEPYTRGNLKIFIIKGYFVERACC